MEYDAAALMAKVIRDARLPRGSQYRDASVLLPMADDETRLVVQPELLKLVGDHAVVVRRVPIVAGKATYRLPSRATRLKDVDRLLPDGKVDLRFSRAEAKATLRFDVPGEPRFWFFQASSIVLAPVPQATDGSELRISFARRPSRLVLPSEAWTVQSVVGGVVTVAGASAPTAGLYDFVKGTTGFESLADDVEVTGTTTVTGGWTLTFASPPAALSELEPGDYLSAAGTSPVPQLPAEYHPVLVASLVCEVLRESGDAEAKEAARSRLEDAKANAQAALAPRSREPPVMVQNDWL